MHLHDRKHKPPTALTQLDVFVPRSAVVSHAAGLKRAVVCVHAARSFCTGSELCTPVLTMICTLCQKKFCKLTVKTTHGNSPEIR